MKTATAVLVTTGIGSALIGTALSGLLGPWGFVLGFGIALLVGALFGLLIPLESR